MIVWGEKTELVWVKNGEIILNADLQNGKTCMLKFENGTQDTDPSGNCSFECYLHRIAVY